VRGRVRTRTRRELRTQARRRLRLRSSTSLCAVFIVLCTLAPAAWAWFHTTNRHWHDYSWPESQIQFSPPTDGPRICSTLQTGVYHLTLDRRWQELGSWYSSCGWWANAYASRGEDNCRKYGWNAGSTYSGNYAVGWHGMRKYEPCP
jgi:hypothetical protein